LCSVACSRGDRLSKLLDVELAIQKPPIKETLKEGEKQKPLGKYEPGEQEEEGKED
jgi:hypothetical protein